MSDSSDISNESTLRIHSVRNNLNTIAMQTELAKMLVEKKGDSAQIIVALDKVLAACVDCSNKLQSNNGNK